MITNELAAAPPRTDRRAPGRRFVQFGLLCLALSWLPWAALGLLGADISRGPGQLIFGLAASGPSLAALALWLRRPGERIRGSGRTTWYGILAGLVLGAAAPTICALARHADNPAAVGTSIAAVTASVGGPLMVFGYTMLTGPLSEEFGWRGYLQPRLRQRFGPIRTTLVLGCCWGAWHLPLFLMPGTGQHRTGLLTLSGLCFFITIIALTFVVLFATERLRGGVWAAIAAHAGFNAMDALLPPLPAAGALLEAVIMTGIAAMCGVAWWMLRRHPRWSDRTGALPGRA